MIRGGGGIAAPPRPAPTTARPRRPSSPRPNHRRRRSRLAATLAARAGAQGWRGTAVPGLIPPTTAPPPLLRPVAVLRRLFPSIHGGAGHSSSTADRAAPRVPDPWPCPGHDSWAHGGFPCHDARDRVRTGGERPPVRYPSPWAPSLPPHGRPREASSCAGPHLQRDGSGSPSRLRGPVPSQPEQRWCGPVPPEQPRCVPRPPHPWRQQRAVSPPWRLPLTRAFFTWGRNQRGTLGHLLETKTESSPGPFDALAGVKVVQTAIGGWHCLPVDDKGRTYAWGGNEYGQCGEEPQRTKDGTRALWRDIPTPWRCVPKLKVRQVAAGGTHSVVLTREGYVWAWGKPWPPGDIKEISI